MTVEYDPKTGAMILDLDEGEKLTSWERFRNYYRRIGIYDLTRIKQLWRSKRESRKSPRTSSESS